jgi:hypothetical protein
LRFLQSYACSSIIIEVNGMRSEDVRTELGIYSLKKKRNVMDRSCIPKQAITYVKWQKR